MCSFGKSKFKDISQISPPVVKIGKSNSIDITTSLACSVLIENSSGEWENFRDILNEYSITIFTDLSPSSKGKKIQNKSFIKRWILTKVIILNDGQEVDNEIEIVKHLINMSFAKLKYYINKAIVDFK